MYVRNYVDQTLQPLILSKQWNELTLIVFFLFAVGNCQANTMYSINCILL